LFLFVFICCLFGWLVVGWLLSLLLFVRNLKHFATAFSLIYQTATDTTVQSLDLICPTAERRQLWAHILTLVNDDVKNANVNTHTHTHTHHISSYRLFFLQLQVQRTCSTFSRNGEAYCLISPFLAHLRDGKSTVNAKIAASIFNTELQIKVCKKLSLSLSFSNWFSFLNLLLRKNILLFLDFSKRAH
jgi:hypothetical protein